MRRHVIARYIGGRDSDTYYNHKQTYPIGIRTRLFSKKVTVYKRRGYFDSADVNSIREFPNMEACNQLFKIIRDDPGDPMKGTRRP